MDIDKLDKLIKELEQKISVNKFKESQEILKLVLLIMAISTGGLLFGAILGQIALGFVTSIFLSIPLGATKAKEIEQITDLIKDDEFELAVHKREKKELNEKLMKVESNPVFLKEEKQKDIPQNKQKYTYKKGERKPVELPHQKTKDIPIEFFGENDFDDVPDVNGPKKR